MWEGIQQNLNTASIINKMIFIGSWTLNCDVAYQLLDCAREEKYCKIIQKIYVLHQLASTFWYLKLVKQK